LIFDISKNETKKEVYNIDTNKLIQVFKDTIINKDTFKRTLDNVSLIIKNDKLISCENEINFSLMKPKKKKDIEKELNLNLGSFDIETYVDKDGKSKVYALGFCTLTENLKSHIFYKDKNISSSLLVITCIKEMLQTKYKDCIFYTHNFGGFDVLFLLKELVQYNKENNNYFVLKCVFKDSRILKLEVSAKISKTVKNKITFIDSLNLLPEKLETLGLSFNVDVTKGVFPYSFVNSDTLYYVGNTPDITYFNLRHKKMDLNEYNNIVSNI
jgi:hypothetical protein